LSAACTVRNKSERVSAGALHLKPRARRMKTMHGSMEQWRRRIAAGICILAGALAVPAAAEQPGKAALEGWKTYQTSVEARLGKQHSSAHTFFAGELATGEGRARVRRGEQIIEHIVPPEG